MSRQKRLSVTNYISRPQIFALLVLTAGCVVVSTDAPAASAKADTVRYEIQKSKRCFKTARNSKQCAKQN